jgi:hypothetical protein
MYFPVETNTSCVDERFSPIGEKVFSTPEKVFPMQKKLSIVGKRCGAVKNPENRKGFGAGSGGF